MSDQVTLARFATLLKNKAGHEVVKAPVVNEVVQNNENGTAILLSRSFQPWEIVVTTLGCIAFVLLCAGLGYFYRRRKQASASPVIQFARA